VIKVINSTKASGPDLINPRLLQEAAPIIKALIAQVIVDPTTMQS
jgi:hypothetical protein